MRTRRRIRSSLDITVRLHIPITDISRSIDILLGGWGPCPVNGECPADLDGDGEVGPNDLAMLLGNWG